NDTQAKPDEQLRQKELELLLKQKKLQKELNSAQSILDEGFNVVVL
ncbi:unnamed protein product, partial [Didymodactylos carnosus]